MAERNSVGTAWLALDDGTVFAGVLAVRGSDTTRWGEVVFNTALTGYQEILTDPSYAGQLVVLTYPLIGNYGVNPAWAESRHLAARGLIVRELDEPDALSLTLSEYCRRQGVWLLTGVDTRALTRHLREAGTRRGLIVDDLAAAREAPARLAGESLHGIVDTVAADAVYELPGDGPHIAVLDYGVKNSILRALQDRGARLTVMPGTVSPDALDAVKPDGVVLSSGPGDPEDLRDRLALVGHAVSHYPTFGICFGHQLIALAAGGRTYPLKFGHHGANHPVRDERSGKVAITSHNHGYAVAEDSLPPGWRVRFRNLHDHTVEGLWHEDLPVLTVQHHPEAGPGPHDAAPLFDEFMDGFGRGPAGKGDARA